MLFRSLAFPGVFRGAIDAGATEITEGMKLAASEAIAAVVGDDLRPDYIVPSPMDRRVEPAVADAVAEAARREGLADPSATGDVEALVDARTWHPRYLTMRRKRA